MSGRENKEFDEWPKYKPWMIECARRLVAAEYVDDIVNMALYDAHNPTKPPPPAENEDRVKAWLWTLLRFRALTVWKERDKRSVETNLEDAPDVFAIAEPADWATTIENRQWLQLALEDLTEEQRNLVLKCDVDSESFAALSRTSGIDEDTLRTRLRRAHDQLRAKLIALGEESRGRRSMFVPVWLFDWLRPKDTQAPRESWSQRTWKALQRMACHPMQMGTHVIAAACVMVLVPGSPCDGDEPLAASIAPEPTVSVEAVGLTPATQVFPGTRSVDSAAPTATSSAHQPMPKLNVPVLPQEKLANDEDDGLLLRAKAALNRRDAKQALEYLAEHERRFPNSMKAARREQLRAAAMKVAEGKR